MCAIVEVEMFFKGPNAIVIEWSDASSGCDNITSVAPYFSSKCNSYRTIIISICNIRIFCLI